MPLKGQLQEDHIPVNKYTMSVVGLVPLLFTTISGLEEETDVVDLPDRTRASGGNTKPGEFTAMMPAHHTTEILAMEAWVLEGVDPVSSTYKKPVNLAIQSGSGGIQRLITINGCWPSKVKTPDLDFENEGEMAVYEFTFQFDSLIRL